MSIVAGCNRISNSSSSHGTRSSTHVNSGLANRPIYLKEVSLLHFIISFDMNNDILIMIIAATCLTTHWTTEE